MKPCIYCRLVAVPRTREHVLQQALGSTAVLDDAVCAECNAAFSALDKDFVDAVDFYYLGRNMRRALGLGLAVRDDGLAVRTRLRPDGYAEHPPQFYEAAPNDWRFIGPDADMLRTVLAELASPESLVVTSRVVTPGLDRPGLAIVRSSRRTYLVEGTNERRVGDLCAEMKARGLQVAHMGSPAVEEAPGHGPPIKYDVSLSLGRFGRAMAKIALNFMCYRLGSEVALLSTYDPLRAFARHGDGDLWAFVKPSLLTGMDNQAAEAWTTGHEHVLILMRDKEEGQPRESVIIVVSGRVIGSVRLQAEGIPAAGLPDGTWLISRCDPVQHRWGDYRMPDDAFRAIINPAALGLEAEWKAIGAHGGSAG